MPEYISRTQIIVGLEEMISEFIQEYICIDRAEAWDWFSKFTGHNTYADCSYEILLELLIGWRDYYATRPATTEQIHQIYDLLESFVQHGVYDDISQAVTDFINTWQDPRTISKPYAEFAILKLKELLR